MCFVKATLLSDFKVQNDISISYFKQRFGPECCLGELGKKEGKPTSEVLGKYNFLLMKSLIKDPGLFVTNPLFKVIYRDYNIVKYD